MKDQNWPGDLLWTLHALWGVLFEDTLKLPKLRHVYTPVVAGYRFMSCFMRTVTDCCRQAGEGCNHWLSEMMCKLHPGKGSFTTTARRPAAGVQHSMCLIWHPKITQGLQSITKGLQAW